jgi:predicted dehydrogenase
MSKPRVAIVGCGYWGQNLMRNFAELREVEIKAACDFNLTALARIKRRYPSVELEPNYQNIVSDPRIDGVVIATPVATHYPFARKALLAGKHVLVEKPLATSSTQALELLELAEKRGKTLMVDHTFVYTGAVQHIKKLVDEQDLGELLYFDSVRISLGLVQSDSNVLWDLGGHDFSILNYVYDRDPISVSATGVKHLGCLFENIAYVSAHFSNNLIAHFHLNWLAPMKVRRTLFGGSKKMVLYDDMEASDKVKIYSRTIGPRHDAEHHQQLLSGYQTGDMVAPNLDTCEALRRMANDFGAAMVDRRTPISDGYAGYRVVRLLEAAQRSMSQGGRPVDLRSSTMPYKESPGGGRMTPKAVAAGKWPNP